MPSLDFSVDPDEVREQIDEHVPAEDKDVPTRELLVLDAALSETDDRDYIGSHKVVGIIHVPTAFCPGLSCDMGGHSKDPLRFNHKSGTNFWVHDGCGLPTRAWWDAHYGDVVKAVGELDA